jgi:hypothetical protein
LLIAALSWLLVLSLIGAIIGEGSGKFFPW